MLKNRRKRKVNNKENIEEYEVINLGYEYPGMTGGVKWAVVTDLDIDVLMRKYGEELTQYMPYVVMTSEQGEAFRDYKRNEAKHEMRRIRHHIFGGYEEGMTEYMNSVFSKEEPEETVMEKLEYERFKEALDKLPPAQKRRCILYFYHGLSEKEIAKAEGVSQQMVSLSLDGALKNLKKYLKL
ncbi:sigma-70 family RNA polymerase sigma factor [Butyrivibrio sp. WCD3002]|uniref:sigma-70 family RNA polymerase sigma factor n=1 Tax=Butyrivibrio sp. WCD3002 TaxID=1280676 RepID=UPI0009DBD8D8|nr:sigma-70 family RNA polymerase sigma factor [Butyrivibrio sp. WCD3002]